MAAATAPKYGKLKVSKHMDNGQTVIRNSKDWIVANMEVDAFEISNEEVRKYTKLFVAAPELLKVLKAAEKEIQYFVSLTGHNFLNILSDIHSAIQKAEA